MIKHYYHSSDEEFNKMSMYKVQSLINNIPMVLGQDDEKESAHQRDKLSNKELVERARKLGLRVPKDY